MSPKRRIAVAAAMAVLAVVVTAGVAALHGKPKAKAPKAPATAVKETFATPAAPTAAGLTMLPSATEERPVEEVLLESGEEPGAVFFMSRVREALNEGNPEFARELLRQMKEEHEKSILFEEAERLFEEKGRKP